MQYKDLDFEGDVPIMTNRGITFRLDRLQQRAGTEDIDSLYKYEVQCLGWSDHKYTATFEPEKCGICGCKRVKVTEKGK